MDIKFEFRHSNLSIVELHKKGIRNLKWLEEVILGESYWEDIFVDIDSTYFATGFTNDMQALVVAFRIDSEMTIFTLDAKRATIEEVKFNYCKFCFKN